MFLRTTAGSLHEWGQIDHDNVDASEALKDENDAFESVKQKKGLGFAKAWAGMLLLANTLLGGSGMLGIPHAMSVSGYIAGMLFMTFFGMASAFGCHLLQCSARQICRVPCSFYTVANAVVPRLTWLIDGAVAIKCFGVATSYMIIVGDLLPGAMASFGLEGGALSRGLWVSVGFAIAAPLASLRSLSSLRYTSAASIFIVMWTLILIVLFYARAGSDFDPCADSISLPCAGAVVEPVGRDAFQIMKVLSIFVFAFTCQQNIFTICNEVKDASNKRVNLIICGAYIMGGTAFVVAALLGYLTYGNQVQKDVLKGYPPNMAVGITKALYSLLAIFSYPLQIHPARVSLLQLWRLAASKRLQSQYSLATLVLLTASFTIAITVKDLEIVLAVVGATGSTIVSYILPGLVYFYTFREPHFKRWLALGQLLLGCAIMPTCLVFIFL